MFDWSVSMSIRAILALGRRVPRRTVATRPQHRCYSVVYSGPRMDVDYEDEKLEGGLDYIHNGPFKLEGGGTLESPRLRYNTYGSLNEARDNVIVICHALTGHSYVHTWCQGLLGSGRAYDTDKYFVVCANVLGSCYGSTGPTVVEDFPDVSVQDSVRLQLTWLKQGLGVRGVKSVIGGSFGGMQALEYCLQGRGFVRSAVPMACGAAHTAWQIGISEAQRQAIYLDPKWQFGNYLRSDPPVQGLSLARQMAMLSYRNGIAFETKFGREIKGHDKNINYRASAQYGADTEWQVKSYLTHQGRKFLERFDAKSYVKLTEQMDSHDVGRGRGGKKKALAAIDIPVLVVGVESDILYPLHEQEELAAYIPRSTLKIIGKPISGHDAFLLEQEHVGALIKKFLGDLS